MNDQTLDPQIHIHELGSRAREVLRGFAEVTLRQPAVRKRERLPSAPERVRISDDGPYDGTLFEALRAWRRS